MELSQMTASVKSEPSGKSESNGQVHESQYSMERQYLKDLLQYIRELMRDFREAIRDPESRTTRTTNDDDNDDNDDASEESAGSNFEMPTPLDLQHDENMLQQDPRSSFGDAEYFKPVAVSANQTISTKQPFDGSWPPATILAHPTSPHERVSQQHGRCASPTLFTIAPSSISGMSSVRSTARRARRSHSFR